VGLALPCRANILAHPPNKEPIMVLIKRSTSSSDTAPPEAPSQYALPEDLNQPSDKLGDYSILLYGAKKIGKTSFAARFPDAIFLSTEPGTKALNVYTVPVKSYKDLNGYIDLLEKDKSDKFKTIILDTVDIAYEHCYNEICRIKKINSPRDIDDFGATWGEIKGLFQKVVIRLLNTGRGIIFISHDTEREIELRGGNKVDRVQPTMSNQAMSVIEAIVDIICNYRYEGTRRFIQLDGSQTVVAGCRLEEHFVRKGGQPRTTGDRIITIPMGNTSQEAYDNFIKAFDNDQELVDVLPTPSVKHSATLAKKG
jgi:hypothetical protein